MNFDNILQSFFNLNLKIEQKFFKKTRFLDEELEKEYRIEITQNSAKNKIYIDAFFLFCIIAIILYIFVHKYKIIFIYIGLACFVVSCILIVISHLKKSSSLNSVIYHIIVFSSSVFMNFKVIYIACFLITQENDNDSEIIRTIVYDFIQTNILCCIALDTRFSVTLILYLMNLTSTLVAQAKSSGNQFYYFDGLVSFIVTMFFYWYRKEMEVAHRVTFGDKYRFKKFYNYTREFIKGLNGYYLNISNDYSINCDSKMINLLREMNLYDGLGRMQNFQRNNENIMNCEENKINDFNSLASIYVSAQKENEWKLSGDFLNRFIYYDEEELSNSFSSDTDKKLGDRLKKIMLEPSTTTFKRLGIFKLESSYSIKYFDVHFRRFNMNSENSIHDIILDDITETIMSRKMIVEEAILRQKILAKIVHEFKTPINSIIGLIGNIEDSLNSLNINENQTTMKHLDTVRHLSNYVIFLISDIIHFSNYKSLEEIKLNPENINLREITNFGFNILVSLLRCNKLKNDAIQPILEFDEKIDKKVIKADEVRLKQIILNLVSNAVKFTKAGWIKLKCSIDDAKECVILSLSDTGIGIPNDEKEKLFSDFKMVKNDSINNALGSGLGLSICKSLATNMNMKISSESVFGQGSKFSLAIPMKLEPSSMINPKCESIIELQGFNEIILKDEIEHIQVLY